MTSSFRSCFISCSSDRGEAVCPFTLAVIIIVASEEGRGKYNLQTVILTDSDIIPFFLSVDIGNPIYFSNSVELDS